jgi:uncharacterized protein YlxW (UPF0749 family)
MEVIIAAAITALMGLFGVMITNASSNRKVEHKLATAQEVTNTKIEHLTDEVRKHNSFAERIPVLETNVKDIERRVERLEEKENG